MLKKFNLLFEEIMDDLNLNFRFNSVSRTFGRFLSADEKRALNKKYNAAIEEILLKRIGTDEKIKIRAYNPESHMITTCFGKINGIDNGIVDWTDNDGKNMKTPISRLIIEDLYDMIADDEEKFMQDFNAKKAEAEKNLETDSSEALQYLIKQHYLYTINLMNALSKTAATPQLVLTISKDKRILSDKHLLDIFKVDTNSKEFKDAKQSAKADGASWYYNGGTTLILKVILDIKEGECFDISRITNEKFEYEYKNSSGVGTQGEF